MSQDPVIAAKARERALQSLKRLTRLFELDAPIVIMQHEVHMLANRLRMEDPHSWARMEADLFSAFEKPRWGYCAMDNCTAERVDGDDYCSAHLQPDDETLQ